jgi:adenine/guanine phosphoribosyltransferase-like PRPP-binding protein
MNARQATPRRVFEHRRTWEATTEDYAAAIRLLAEEADRQHAPIVAVLGIAEGGRHPAHDIAHRLGVAKGLVPARHNLSGDPYTQATGSVDFDPAGLRRTLSRLIADSPPAGTLLVVDDICGSGATLATVAGAIGEMRLRWPAVRTATLCRNAAAPPGMPDLHIWDVADWVRFGWEPPLAHGHVPPVTPLPTPTMVMSP